MSNGVTLMAEPPMHRGRRFSLMVGTPMYGGQCHGAYTDSMMKLAVLCAQHGVKFEFFPIFNESHIDRGRNMSVEYFLRSGFSHFMFIDSDLAFTPTDVLRLLELTTDDNEREVACGFYPKKVINWKKIVEAVKAGYADKDPLILEQFVGDMVFTPALNETSLESRSIYEPVKIHEGGTGFMMMQRRVFEVLEETYPELAYQKDGNKPDLMTCFFDAKIDPTGKPYKRFLTEDYDFCRLLRSVGIDIWLCPWMKLVHYGSYRFIGNIEALSMAYEAKKKREAEAA